MVMKEINSVIEDLELLKRGEWEPDEDSINASLEMLERANNKIENLIKIIKNPSTITQDDIDDELAKYL